MNGFHDAANSIATIVSTRVMRPQWAVVWAAFFNFIAFLFFGLHVLWPQGLQGPFDAYSALIALTAATALFGFKRGVIEVIAGCALAGLAIYLSR